MKTSSSSTYRTVAAHIRFQLDQLSAQNAHHEFEHLCRQYSRERIARNILPATGPVSVGGDQGRDFETFTSFVAATKGRDSRYFLGAAESRALVFACSLTAKARVKAKIKSDVTEICDVGSPYLIYFFSNQSIPVPWRHELQAWSLDQKKCRLEIIDAEALSEQLAEPGLFWIAEQYLHVPADLFPSSGHETDATYRRIHSHWIDEARTPSSFSDFVEIKLGLRRATFEEKLKPDLSRWISKMKIFIDVNGRSQLQRRASYEICVAALRGQHNLTPWRTLVEKYFDTWSNTNAPSELRDAAILLSYVSSAVLNGEFAIEPSQLHTWSKNLVETVNHAISKALGPNSLADLLYTRSTLASLPFLDGIEPCNQPEQVFKWWKRTADAAAKAPLFPVEEFADLLTRVAEYFGGNPKYDAIVEKIDALLEARSKGYLSAEKARDRAIALMEKGKTVSAIQELHKAKVKWFTGDTLEGTLLSMLSLSHAYLRLGLIWAAKYHALGAAFIIAKSDDDHLQGRLPGALCQLGECQYVGGEWASFSELVSIFFVAHYEHAQDPDDWTSHSDMQRTVFHFLVARSLSKALGGQAAVQLIETPFRQLSMPEDLRSEVLSPPLPLEHYESMTTSEVLKKTSAELWGKPFSDCGPERDYAWQALGIAWRVSSVNSVAVIPHVEEFVAVLQIATVDLSRVDLCLLPTSVSVNVTLWEGEHAECKQVPDNTKMIFSVRLPLHRDRDPGMTTASQREILGVTATLLAACSCLPDDKFQKALGDALKHGLVSKTFLVRPYFELFREFVDNKDFDSRHGQSIGNLDTSEFELRQSDELSWIDSPGPGYSKAKSLEFIANRYRRAHLPIRQTLARLNTSERFRRWVVRMRTEGMRDWQILLLILNSVLNYRAGALGLNRDPRRFEEFSRIFTSNEEPANSPEFPEDFLIEDPDGMMQLTTLATNAQVWGLRVRPQTPDFRALRRLLDIRYGQAEDDIPHEDIFLAP